MTLTEAVAKIIQEFGTGVISEKRFLYMVSDYHSFRNSPADKHILSAIVTEGIAGKFLNVTSMQNAQLLIGQISYELCQKYGFKEDLVQSVLSKIYKGLPNSEEDVSADHHKTSRQTASLKETSSFIKKNKSIEEANTLYNFIGRDGFSKISKLKGEELYSLISKYVLSCPIHCSKQYILNGITKEYNSDIAIFLFDYFILMKVISYHKSWNMRDEYFSSKMKAMTFMEEHNKVFQKHEPKAIAEHIKQLNMADIDTMTLDKIQKRYNVDSQIANNVLKVFEEEKNKAEKRDEEMTRLSVYKKVIKNLMRGSNLETTLKGLEPETAEFLRKAIKRIQILNEHECFDNKILIQNYYTPESTFINTIINRILKRD